MEKLTGIIEHIVYRNEGNGYTVLTLDVSGEEITGVGTLPFVGEGETIEAEGRFVRHASYGEQFQISSCEVRTPEDSVAVERYLGSGAIKGVGLALAARIVRRFGNDTLRIISEEPERLAEVKGISDRGAREIAAQIEAKKDMREAMLFLSQYGISMALADKIYRHYGNDLYRVIRENPYRMADEVEGIGFKIADEIAVRAGILVDSDFRVRSGIFYVLQQAAAEGHIYLPRELLRTRTCLLLNINLEQVDGYLRDLSVERKIVVKTAVPGEPFALPDAASEGLHGGEEPQIRVYAASMYYMELNTARMLHDLNISGKIDEQKIRRKIAGLRSESGREPDEMQIRACMEAVRSGLMILTGGPGTGKTTTINMMIRYFRSENLEIALAAPTGRAAKRMTEATGYEAKTIHRLLEVNGGVDSGTGEFTRNQDYPLEADVIIVDEMSMVDLKLMHALLCAIPIGTRLVMVGDVNQLPSVGPGSVLRDMIDAQFCPVVRLTRIFRQAEESDIVVNAHRINRGEHMPLDNKSRDFFFLKRYQADQVAGVCMRLIQEKLPGYVNAPREEIQLLTPTRKGDLGVETLNRLLQERLNPRAPGRQEYIKGDTLLREGDKVMQIRNNYQMEWEVRGKYGIPVEKGTGVFNGDMGTIREINTYTQQITVEFDEHRMAEYPFTNLDELELAYAVTIHKSQGSEYPAVVVPLLAGPRMLMNRNLIYTAVTRAKKCVVLVGDPEVFFRMIDNTTEQKRYTTLADQLREIEKLDNET